MDVELKIDILINCHEDDVGLWFLIGIIANNLDISEKELKTTTLNIALKLLEEGVVKAGFPQVDGSFKQKIDSAKDIVNSIKKEWDELGRDPTIGDIICFYITEKGRKELMELLMKFFQKHRRIQIE